MTNKVAASQTHSRKNSLQTPPGFPAACFILAATVLSAKPALAIDTQALDFNPGPTGMFIGLVYNVFGESNEYISSSGTSFKNDTRLQSDITLFRLLHFYDVGGHTLGLNAVLPVVQLGSGEIAGNRLNHVFNVGDPFIDVTYWIKQDDSTKTYLGVSNFLTFPIGSYDASNVLNAGGNRFVETFEGFANTGIGSTIELESLAQVTAYTRNNDYGAAGEKMSQAPTFTLTGWVDYAVAPDHILSLGYRQNLGGIQTVGGVANGTKTDESTVRVAYQQFVAPTWQVYCEVNHDVMASGGFRQNIGVTLRLMKVF